MKYKTFSSLYFKLCIRAVESSCNNFVPIPLTPPKRPCYNGTQEGYKGDKMRRNT